MAELGNCVATEQRARVRARPRDGLLLGPPWADPGARPHGRT